METFRSHFLRITGVRQIYIRVNKVLPQKNIVRLTTGRSYGRALMIRYGPCGHVILHTRHRENKDQKFSGVIPNAGNKSKARKSEKLVT